MKWVTKWLRGAGYSVVSREEDKIGYDLEARRGRSCMHVEVKGISGDEPRFPITRSEVECAGQDPAFRLIVVTRALSKQPLLHEFTGRQFKQQFKLSPISFLAVRKR